MNRTPLATPISGQSSRRCRPDYTILPRSVTISPYPVTFLPRSVSISPCSVTFLPCSNTEKQIAAPTRQSDIFILRVKG